jgi:hypothetical protein
VSVVEFVFQAMFFEALTAEPSFALPLFCSFHFGLGRRPDFVRFD